MSSNKNPSDEVKQTQKDANRDPLSGRAGAHPVGTGIGAATGGVAAGAATGAAVGTVAGPVGTAVGAAVGAVVGAVAGGLAGKGVAEEINPTVEHGFWRENYSARPYVTKGETYEQYAPAYELGWQNRTGAKSESFDDAEDRLRADWDRNKGGSKLGWDRAREAAKDSWDRVSTRGGDTERNSSI